jgi:hypothetical protein
VLSRAASNPANEICLGDVVREREGPEMAYGFTQKFWPNPVLHSDAAKSAAPVSLVRSASSEQRDHIELHKRFLLAA